MTLEWYVFQFFLLCPFFSLGVTSVANRFLKDGFAAHRLPWNETADFEFLNRLGRV